jgi:hypothetical protein
MHCKPVEHSRPGRRRVVVVAVVTVVAVTVVLVAVVVVAVAVVVVSVVVVSVNVVVVVIEVVMVVSVVDVAVAVVVSCVVEYHTDRRGVGVNMSALHQPRLERSAACFPVKSRTTTMLTSSEKAWLLTPDSIPYASVKECPQ